jgi:hypothetical protein
MRYILKPPGDTLQWLVAQDSHPHVLPLFPPDEAKSLVCSSLISGEVVADVVTSAAHLSEICGRGFPLGRLYFQIAKSALYMVCPELTPAAFGGESA